MAVYAKSPFYGGVAFWNDLPVDIQNLDTVAFFKNAVKRHLNIF